MFKYQWIKISILFYFKLGKKLLIGNYKARHGIWQVYAEYHGKKIKMSNRFSCGMSRHWLVFPLLVSRVPTLVIEEAPPHKDLLVLFVV